MVDAVENIINKASPKIKRVGFGYTEIHSNRHLDRDFYLDRMIEISTNSLILLKNICIENNYLMKIVKLIFKLQLYYDLSVFPKGVKKVSNSSYVKSR